MTKGCLFMCFGTKHNGHQVVAFHSLRKHYRGQVAIICDEQNRLNMQKLVDQDSLKATQLVIFKPYTRHELGAGAGYLNKTRLIELSPFMHSVFLDCDTCTVGDVSPMFPADVEVRLTQFSDWVTTGNKMAGRIRKWLTAMPAEASLHLAVEYPAINTGVMGLSKLDKKLSQRWQEVTAKNVSFMCDELAMQLIFLEGPHVVMPDYFNCSPIYSPGRRGFDESRVRIWHGHGFKSLRSPKGLSIWLPEILELWSEGAFGVREAFQENRYFSKLTNSPLSFIRDYAGDVAEQLIDQLEITERTFT